MEETVLAAGSWRLPGRVILRRTQPEQRAAEGHSVEPAISSLIASAETGDPSAAQALFAALYSELHRLARSLVPRKGKDMTLGTTTLLHEAYVRMAGREGAVFPDRGRFMAYAARVMRTLIIDHVRSRRAQRRGGQFEITSLPAEVADPTPGQQSPERLARLGDAVDELALVDPQLAEIVDLKFFCGFSFAEIAAMRGLSERTVQRHWEKARLFLHEEVAVDEPS
jgi:RNA polymerase sigma factor (TIGR02999 family)